MFAEVTLGSLYYSNPERTCPSTKFWKSPYIYISLNLTQISPLVLPPRFNSQVDINSRVSHKIKDDLPYSVNGTTQLHPQETWAIPFSLILSPNYFLNLFSLIVFPYHCLKSRHQHLSTGAPKLSPFNNFPEPWSETLICPNMKMWWCHSFT